MKNISHLLDNIADYLKTRKFMGIQLDNLLFKSILVIVLMLTITAILPTERPFEYSNLTVGSVSGSEIIAPMTFPIIKSDETLRREREEAWLRVPPVFKVSEEVESIQKTKLKNFFNELAYHFKTLSAGQSAADSAARSGKLSIADTLQKLLSVKYNIPITTDDLAAFFTLYQDGSFFDYLSGMLVGFTHVYNLGLMDTEKSQIRERNIAQQRNGLEEVTELENVLDINEARNYFQNIVSKSFRESLPKQKLTQLLVTSFLSPNLIYQKEITNERKDKAIREVPTSSGFVYKNQRIVDNHEVITPEIYSKLQSYSEALKEKSTADTGWNHALFLLGKIMLSLLLTVMLGFFIWYSRPKIFRDNKLLLLITLVLVLQFLFAILVVDILGWSYLSIPIILGPMLLSMLLDALIAFWGTVVISFVLGASQGNNFYLALMVMVIGTIALFAVQKIRNRGQMFRAILYISIGYAVLNFSYGFLHYESFKTMLQNYLFFQLPNAILTPTAAFLLIGVFERFFDVTTDVTLLELSDMNHPLLKRLSVEAPGTFHHSLLVGNLAETAAKAIGANSLLARVGCYYHDVGKIQKAEYFVENQPSMVSKHENLTPNMSCLILVKHVKGGIELAERYRLPRAVRQFIPEHHGTSLMEYFYHKAKETMDPKDINEDDYRYPGPKPQSRETAIAMLADSVEAASRTLPNPNMQRLTALVENLVEKRFREGELDECDLTLRGLNKIKDAFIRLLMGIHHVRIEYPAESGEKSKKGGEGKGDKSDTAKRSEKQTAHLPAEKNGGGNGPEFNPAKTGDKNDPA